MKPCTVEVLLLGVRELLSKPRKAQLVCEYICAGEVQSTAQFRIFDSSLNPSFTSPRLELERKSVGSLRKMIKESVIGGLKDNEDAARIGDAVGQTPVRIGDLKDKEKMVDWLMQMPQLRFTNVPFVYGSTTALRITILEKPLVSRELKPVGSTTIVLTDDASTSNAASQVDIDQDVSVHALLVALTVLCCS
jgi:hypothetical protein